jgi:nucleoside-diphosphate-sugar epimerase
MPGEAFLVGGTGNVGRAVARRLVETGWDVTVAGRSGALPEDLAQDVRAVRLDRDDDGALADANGSDVVIDVIPFERRHAEQLLALDVGAIVAISSASVYADEGGRTLDEAQGVDDFPDFPVPIPETQRTVDPGEATYSTKKVALERALLENGPVPATIVRPCAIYGRGDRMAREFHFVKRALDNRPYVVLTGRGESLFHTTASENVGELVRLVCEQPGTRVFNCGDPDPPTLLQISRRIADTLGHERTEVLLPTWAARGETAQTPWSTPKPLLVDMQAAERELGYRPVVGWRDAVVGQVRWLAEVTRGRDWKEVLPRGAQYLRFDYDAEDALVGELVP